MEVTVKISGGTLAQIIGRGDITVQCEDPIRVIDILNMLEGKFGKPFGDYVFDRKTGKVQKYLILAVNGVNVSSVKGVDTLIEDHGELLIFSATGGG
jgi:molybdopterin converting factor small subunit